MRCDPDAIEASRPGDEANWLRHAFADQTIRAVIAEAECARLREAIRRLVDQDATLAVQGNNSEPPNSSPAITDRDRVALNWALATRTDEGHGDMGMSDIVGRLRKWFKAVNAVSAIDLMDEAANEIERLREAIRRLADQDATLAVQGGHVIVTLDATLTDRERVALNWAIATLDAGEPDAGQNAEAAAVLTEMVERLA